MYEYFRPDLAFTIPVVLKISRSHEHIYVEPLVNSINRNVRLDFTRPGALYIRRRPLWATPKRQHIKPNRELMHEKWDNCVVYTNRSGRISVQYIHILDRRKLSTLTVTNCSPCNKKKYVQHSFHHYSYACIKTVQLVVWSQVVTPGSAVQPHC